MSSYNEYCEHHDDQVAVQIYDLEKEEHECFWCTNTADYGFVKSERHELALCSDCMGLMAILLQSVDSQEGEK